MAQQKPKTLIGLDGIERQPDQEESLNAVSRALFSSDAGKVFLSYLRTITIETVAGPEVSDDQLRHLEGQRYIVGLIQRRSNKGQSQKIVEESRDNG
jgi:hypothetical protein|tara:strand:- start:1262 stop:1552 length:291 start_codon:yes stop_codon:yes gene_type:complete